MNEKKMSNILKLNKMIVYVIIGITILIFNEHLINYLHLIVGISMLVLGIEGLMFDILDKKYKALHNHIGSEIVSIVLSIVILFFLNKDVGLICVIWGILAILRATNELNKCFYHMAHKEHFLISLLESIAQITFAVLLVTDPYEHVDFHIILLGIEYLLEASRILINSTLRHAIEKKKRIIISEDDISDEKD